MKRPTVLGIATATPPLAIGQEELFDTFFARIYASVPNARQLFEATKIRQRHFSWDPREAFAGGVPSTASRVACWRDAVLGMAGSTLSALFRDHDRARVGSRAAHAETDTRAPPH